MTYQETINFLFSQLPAYHRIGKPAYKADLRNTIELDNYFGHPHRNYIKIHVAGTNGKGSVSHMLASVLMTAGYRTALYTSPHLKDFRERIKINGEMIPCEEVVSFVEKHSNIINLLKPSFFEMTTAMAFDYFARQNVDVAVIETGLGGRLDSTNIILPVLSIITNIGYDHMDLLGNTFEKVAGEKAGIIKENVPVIIGESDPETDEVFNIAARLKGTEIEFADKLYTCQPGKFDPEEEMREFYLKSNQDGKEYIFLSPLTGDYQAKNIPVLVTSIHLLNKKGILKINDEDIKTGIRDVIRNTGLAGRWQILGHKPLIICDTAHNRNGIEFVVRQLEKISAVRKHLVIGFVSDKPLENILPLLPVDACYYFTRASVVRALDEGILKEKALAYGLKGEAFGTVREAFEAAKAAAGENDLIFIGGSTFVVGDLL